jgi:cation diffusion facilitator family transporter
MVADGIHSLSDLLSDIDVLAFTHISSKGKDKNHSFGHGKFETLATLIVSVILAAVGGRLMVNGVKSIIEAINGNSIPVPGTIALWAAIISIVSKEILYQATIRTAKRANSPVAMANAWHHRSDALSSIGSLAGIAGAMVLGENCTILGPIASCCISIAIIIVAVKMALPSLEELLETSLPDEIEKDIISVANSVQGVENIHELKTRRNGVSYIIDAHIVVNPRISVTEAHNIATDVENAIREKYGNETQINTHIEPDKESL